MMPRTPTHARGGFTLVEIALALLVLAIGMTVLIGLFPAGLSQNKESIDETRAAMFADDVLNAVRAYAVEAPWGSLAGSWTIDSVAPDVWKIPVDVPVNAGSEQTLKFILDRPSNTANIESFVLKYSLEVAPVSFSRMGVTLQVVNGEFEDIQNGKVYYTELFYNGT